MKITYLRRGAFPRRYGPGGNRAALYGLRAPMTVQDFRALLKQEQAK